MTEQPNPYASQPTSSYATWGDRAVATLWDAVYLWPVVVAFIVSGVLLGIGGGINSDQTTGAGTTLVILGSLGLAASYIWLFVRSIRNYVVIQGRTGQSWGKARKGLWVVNEQTGAVPGWGSCLGRMLLHSLINQAVYIDYLWPLWDKPKVQTLTDKILTTVVVKRA
ncbi:RDD family protein [Nocardioides jiangxiensis]|uniref:RDD family protein n=1 Tax=Nocardioides jiangxiensis TaxID=3064524 RepID=A0ABT9AZN9_9ACTN|nr:RDD family protein [Nocardioides sp. WY-20]MDO7868056.1 RDD family protein [Nocardioides sp. WY-20]